MVEVLRSQTLSLTNFLSSPFSSVLSVTPSASAMLIIKSSECKKYKGGRENGCKGKERLWGGKVRDQTKTCDKLQNSDYQ